MTDKPYAVMTPLSDIRPYENNPRDNRNSVAKVAESIKTFGFLQPIVCDSDGVILAGHTRYQAALSLGLKEAPVLFARDLTPAQARAYRLADNKVSEGSKWLDDLLGKELEALEIEAPEFVPADFGFDTDESFGRRKQWQHVEKECDLKRNIRIYPKCCFNVTTFFNTSADGRPISEIKSDPDMVQPFAEITADYLTGAFGNNFSRGGWCIVTTPRRRHGTGFHFATEVSRKVGEILRIPFYEDAVTAHNRRRINTDFMLQKDPAERNVILFDDIITTGVTVRDTRALLIDSGHCVFPVIAIKN